VAAAAAFRALPWKRILVVAQIVVVRLGEDVPPEDRGRLARLVRQSKGDPRRLSGAERREVLAIVRRVDVNRLSRELAGVAAAGRLLRR
jgi:hypothetical protein